MLPTNTQFLNSLYALRAASEQATLAYYFEGNGHNADGYKTRAITELKLAATSLGFELVERIPRPLASGGLIKGDKVYLAGESANDLAEVTPAARDGGRMQMEEGEDA